MTCCSGGQTAFMLTRILCTLLPFLLLLTACRDDPGNSGENEVIAGPYDPQPYVLEVPSHFPAPFIPEDNPMTVEGVELGRQLFYEKRLSANNSMSCGSCHHQDKAFTDGAPVSFGVRGVPGIRSSMSLANLAWNTRTFFWDGRAHSLEMQALEPVEDHLEMDDSWENVLEKLRDDSAYPTAFRAAFGIDRKSDISRELVVKAISQFERSLVSSNSRYDRVVWKNEGFFTDLEERGRELFFVEFAQDVDHPGCSHCHNQPFFTDFLFHNNGLDSVGRLDEFADRGVGGANGNFFDNGKFRTPTLRNIAVTAPYMHDGRFATLEEVLDHYSKGGHGVENENPNIRPFPLSESDKAALIAFLQTLTDDNLLENPAFSDPN